MYILIYIENLLTKLKRQVINFFFRFAFRFVRLDAFVFQVIQEQIRTVHVYQLPTAHELNKLLLNQKPIINLEA